MFYYFLLLLLPVVSCVQSISQKQYNYKVEKPNAIVFSFVTSVIALLFFLITSGFQLEFHASLIPYSVLYGIGYASAWVGTVLAVKYGSMALSTMITSCSLIFPVTYGIIIGDTITPQIILGMVFLLASIVLVNLKFSGKSGFSLKWFIAVMASFIGNGLCSTMQNMQKHHLGDTYSHEFMIIALVTASLLLLIYALVTSKNFLSDMKGCLVYTAANGTANGVINLLLLTLIGNIPAAVLYPSVSALNLTAIFLLAFFAYKERFSYVQYLGYALGTVSIVLLNI